MATYEVAVSASWNNAASANKVVAIGAIRERALVTDPNAGWWKPVFDRMTELTNLPAGWDGYNAPAVSFDTAWFTLHMLQSLCMDMDIEPQVIPGSSGDLQVEWHEETSSVELHVRRPNEVHAWRLVHATSREEELSLTNNFAPILPWMTTLSEQAGAAVAAAV